MDTELELTLREARAEDCRFVWEVNNHPTVRANAIRTSEIPWPSHKEWFANVSTNPTRHLWIAEYQDNPIGVARLDEDDDAMATITVALSPEHRGKGLGTALIRSASEKALFGRELERVIALIRPDNVASLTAFRNSGYTFDCSVTVHEVELERYIYEGAS